MKKIYILTLIGILTFTVGKAQTNMKVGAGYFGNTLTFPGAVIEYEIEKMFSEKASLPIRADIGLYYHKRYNTGVFTDINIGFRRYFKSGLFLEESIGFGIISSFVNADNVYSIDDSGNLTETSSYATTDLMPSITLGAGYKINEKSSVWFRPKIYWQFPHKTSSFYSVAIQIGYSHTFKTK